MRFDDAEPTQLLNGYTLHLIRTFKLWTHDVANEMTHILTQMTRFRFKFDSKSLKEKNSSVTHEIWKKNPQTNITYCN